MAWSSGLEIIALLGDSVCAERLGNWPGCIFAAGTGAGMSKLKQPIQANTTLTLSHARTSLRFAGVIDALIRAAEMAMSLHNPSDPTIARVRP